MKFKTQRELLTEKGKVKADIRKELLAKVSKHPEMFAKAEQVKEGVYQIPFVNADGKDKVYVRFTIQVSEKSADELATPKKKEA